MAKKTTGNISLDRILAPVVSVDTVMSFVGISSLKLSWIGRTDSHAV